MLRLPLPPLAEQTQIAAVLSAAQHEITLLTTQLEALKQQKRGLMQKLLEGETPKHRRLNVTAISPQSLEIRHLATQ